MSLGWVWQYYSLYFISWQITMNLIKGLNKCLKRKEYRSIYYILCIETYPKEMMKALIFNLSLQPMSSTFTPLKKGQKSTRSNLSYYPMFASSLRCQKSPIAYITLSYWTITSLSSRNNAVLISVNLTIVTVGTVSLNCIWYFLLLLIMIFITRK